MSLGCCCEASGRKMTWVERERGSWNGTCHMEITCTQIKFHWKYAGHSRTGFLTLHLKVILLHVSRDRQTCGSAYNGVDFTLLTFCLHSSYSRLPCACLYMCDARGRIWWLIWRRVVVQGGREWMPKWNRCDGNIIRAYIVYTHMG